MTKLRLLGFIFLAIFILIRLTSAVNTEPDLTVLDITFDPDDPAVGNIMIVNATVKNIGDVATAFFMKLVVTAPNGNVFIITLPSNQNNLFLEPEEEMEVEFIGYGPLIEGEYRNQVTAISKTTDADLSNNELTETVFVDGCVIPTNGMIIDENTVLCPGIYGIPDGITIVENDVSLRCDNTRILAIPRGEKGINIQGLNNVRVEGCALEGYNYGIFIENSNNIEVIGNDFLNSVTSGVELIRSTENVIERNTFEEGLIGARIKYESSDNSFLMNNLALNGQGFTVYTDSENNLFADNILTQHSGNSISISGPSQTLINNTVVDTDGTGIALHSSNNALMDNRVSESRYDGIFSDGSFNVFSGNILRDNRQHGISLSTTHDNEISNNVIFSNDQSGIEMSNALRNNLLDNQIFSNGRGIKLLNGANELIISGNDLQTNYDAGILSTGPSESNLIYNNLFNNTENIILGEDLPNFWNLETKTPGLNIVNGHIIGGNFWASPDGDGFSQTCVDSTREGICDDEYEISSENIDFFPLSRLQRQKTDALRSEG